jgi:uncharacterized protein (DUF433 family)
MPVSTLRDWTISRRYHKDVSVITPPARNPTYLSFNNLVEAHVLFAIRKTFLVPFRQVKTALDYLRDEFQSRRPLLNELLSVDRINVFVEKHGQLFEISRKGQAAMQPVLGAYLNRIERDPAGIPLKLYLMTRDKIEDLPKFVMINPYISFGRPVLVAKGIPTSVIYERFRAGDPIQFLAEDYGIEISHIEEAIRCEQLATAA